MSDSHTEDPSSPEYWGLRSEDVKVYTGGHHGITMEGPNIQPYVLLLHLPSSLYVLASDNRKGQLTQKIEALGTLRRLVLMYHANEHNLKLMTQDALTAFLERNGGADNV